MDIRKLVVVYIECRRLLSDDLNIRLLQEFTFVIGLDRNAGFKIIFSGNSRIPFNEMQLDQRIASLN